MKRTLGRVLGSLFLVLCGPAAVSATVLVNTIDGLNDRPDDVIGVDLSDGDCAGYAACGGDFGVYKDTLDGYRANPHGRKASSDYLAVPQLDDVPESTNSNDLPGGTSWFSINDPTTTTAHYSNYFSLLWGTVDTFNTLHFSRNDALVASIGGTEILDWFHNDIDNAKGKPNLYLEFSFLQGDGFDTIWFESDKPSFESTDHAFRLLAADGEDSGVGNGVNRTQAAGNQKGKGKRHPIDSDNYVIAADGTTVNAVPLPGSLALILAGLIAGGVSRTRRAGMAG